jgi:hypothetical protein
MNNMEDTEEKYFVQSRNILCLASSPQRHKVLLRLQYQMDMDVQLLLNAREIPYIYWAGSWVNFADSLDVVAKRNVPGHVRN